MDGKEEVCDCIAMADSVYIIYEGDCPNLSYTPSLIDR